ncbi:PQQ-binding-like beta-propeller repeat protein [bacterium]|nr:PQQ-binding-like beta-propeller repeat protein [bacterium]
MTDQLPFRPVLMCIFSLLVSFTASRSLIGQTGGDWPCWRGSAGDGISRETNWNAGALRAKDPVLWSVSLGQGHSAVAVRDGRLYTQGSRAGGSGQRDYEEVIYCLDAVSGAILWERSYAAEPMAQTGPRATPAVDGDYVYTLGAKGDVFCCSVQDGSVRWQRQLVDEGVAGASKWGYSASPLVLEDRLIINAGSSGLALDKTTGEVIWKSGLPSWGLATPVRAAVNGQDAVLLNTEYTLYAVAVADGAILWEYRWPYGDADPVLADGHVYLFGGKPGNERSRVLLNPDDGSVYRSWQVQRMNVNFVSPLFYNGCLYGITWDKRTHILECFDPQAGEVRWERKLADWAGLSLADGKLLLIETDGHLTIADASPGRFFVLSKAKVLNMRNLTGGGEDQPLACWTAPVLCNGLVYVRNSHGELACIDLRR